MQPEDIPSVLSSANAPVRSSPCHPACSIKQCVCVWTAEKEKGQGPEWADGGIVSLGRVTRDRRRRKRVRGQSGLTVALFHWAE